MSRLTEYHAWMEARARKDWLETLKWADDLEAKHKDATADSMEGQEVAAARRFADSAYHAYCVIGLDNPGNYSAHKRTTHSRRARRRWLS